MHLFQFFLRKPAGLFVCFDLLINNKKKKTTKYFVQKKF